MNKKSRLTQNTRRYPSFMQDSTFQVRNFEQKSKRTHTEKIRKGFCGQVEMSRMKLDPDKRFHLGVLFLRLWAAKASSPTNETTDWAMRKKILLSAETGINFNIHMLAESVHMSVTEKSKHKRDAIYFQLKSKQIAFHVDRTHWITFR